MPDVHSDRILILYSAQYTQLIARRLR